MASKIAIKDLKSGDLILGGNEVTGTQTLVIRGIKRVRPCFMRVRFVDESGRIYHEMARDNDLVNKAN